MGARGWLVICTEQTTARPGNLQRQCNIREIRLDTGELAAKFSEAAPTILESAVALLVPLFAALESWTEVRGKRILLIRPAGDKVVRLE